VPPPIEITPEIAAKCGGPDQFSKFDRLVRKVLAIPPKAHPPKSVRTPRKTKAK